MSENRPIYASTPPYSGNDQRTRKDNGVAVHIPTAQIPSNTPGPCIPGPPGWLSPETKLAIQQIVHDTIEESKRKERYPDTEVVPISIAGVAGWAIAVMDSDTYHVIAYRPPSPDDNYLAEVLRTEHSAVDVVATRQGYRARRWNGIKFTDRSRHGIDLRVLVRRYSPLA